MDDIMREIADKAAEEAVKETVEKEKTQFVSNLLNLGFALDQAFQVAGVPDEMIGLVKSRLNIA